MKTKDQSINLKILQCAKSEFMDKGFADASMRRIAEKAGVTTGMLYSRFADKEEIFAELVRDGADKLYGFFMNAQNAFAAFPPEKQHSEMHSYVDKEMDVMIDIIYDNFDAFKLIICKSGGSRYHDYVDKMVEVETKNTKRFIECLRESGVKINNVRADLSHMLSSAMFNGVFEVVAHDLPKEDAVVYISQLMEFFNVGWDKLLGL